MLPEAYETVLAGSWSSLKFSHVLPQPSSESLPPFPLHKPLERSMKLLRVQDPIKHDGHSHVISLDQRAVLEEVDRSYPIARDELHGWGGSEPHIDAVVGNVLFLSLTANVSFPKTWIRDTAMSSIFPQTTFGFLKGPESVARGLLGSHRTRIKPCTAGSRAVGAYQLSVLAASSLASDD